MTSNEASDYIALCQCFISTSRERLQYQAGLDGLSLAEMVEKLVAARQEEENGLDGASLSARPGAIFGDYDASTSVEDNRRRPEQSVPGKCDRRALYPE